MCGFAGFISFDGPSLDAAERRAVLERMGHLLAHRGPDDQTFYDDGVLSLVFRRLSIVDLAGGEQPILSEDASRLIVVNGEIYNHAELRRDLAQRHRFRTRSDSEVPLHLYAERGPDALAALRGMFALAHWDRNARELFLARDRCGIKPLYVCRLPQGLLFGSELKALLAHPQCPREPDWADLVELGPHPQARVPSYVRGVEHLPGGHWLRVRDGRVETRAWWRIDDHLGAAPFGDDLLRYRTEFERLIDDATTEHLLGDVPIGLHLSGGVDSSLLAALVARRTRDVACFSVVEYATWNSGDVEAARRVTGELGLPWHPVLFDRKELLDQMQFDLARLEQSVQMMDSPRFDPEWIFKEELHRYARREVPDMKVVLLGQGIDEFAGGYSRRINVAHGSWLQYLHEEVEPELRYWNGVASGLPERLRDLSHVPADEAGWSPYQRKMRAFAWQLQHFNLWHEDRTSMSQSLEARVPYLDHRIVELLASIPEKLHGYLFWNKRIVRDAIGRYLPSYDTERPKIPFFHAGDTRAINALLQQMLRRALPGFLDKYGDDLPFARDALESLAARALDPERAVVVEGWRLMECMVIAIFARQCRDPSADDFGALRARLAGAPSVTDEEWTGLEQRLSEAPQPPAIAWRLGDRIALPRGVRIVTPLGQESSFELNAANGMQATITVPPELAWVKVLLHQLAHAEPVDFTLKEWADEFDLAPEALRAALDALYQAGFIVRLPAEADAR